jgi:hypothetical protein
MTAGSYQIRTASFEWFYEKAPHLRGFLVVSDIVQRRELGV